MTDSVNFLVDVCTSAAPGQKECDNAVRNIQAMQPLLDNPSEPISDASYFDCLDTVMEKSKSLGKYYFFVSNVCKKWPHELSLRTPTCLQNYSIVKIQKRLELFNEISLQQRIRTNNNFTKIKYHGMIDTL